MALLLNLSFETAGAGPGEADSWTSTFLSTGVGAVADFSGGVGPSRSIESFEYLIWFGAGDYQTEITLGTGATFDETFIDPPAGAETFDRWFGPLYLLEISGGAAAQFESLLLFESFEGWTGLTYLTAIPGGGAVSVTEDFVVDDWIPAPPYVTTIVGGTAATFNTASGTAAFESFEDIRLDLIFTADPATDILTTLAPHGYVSNQKLTTYTTGLRPEGLVQNVSYYAIVGGALSSTELKLSKTSGPGAAMDITSAGVGEHRFKADPTKYWTG